MSHRAVVASATLVLAGVASMGRPQASPPAAAGAEIVRLDAVVTDKDGRLVRDLSAADFELFEDGKPQRLSHFLFVGVQGAAATRPASPATPAVSQGEATATRSRSAGRYVIILVDDLHIAATNLEPTRVALRRVVRESLAVDDKAALVTTGGPGGVLQLTENRAPLERAIDALTFREAIVAPAHGSQMTPAQAELVLRGDTNALHLASRVLMDEPGSVYSGTTPRSAVEATGGAGPASILDPQERAAANEVKRQARAILDEALRFSAVTLSRLDDVLRGLAPLPGRKLCLFVSDGFLVGMGTIDEQTRHLRRVVDAATRSGAVVYALDARGLVSTVGAAATAAVPAPPGLQEKVARLTEQEFQQTLLGLANDTGGFLVRGTNELAAGLGRMLQDNDAYYLMAYEPANAKRDGKFRKIEVRVASRPELTVRTRHGYFAPDERKKAEAGGTGAAGSLPVSALDEAEARAILGGALPSNGTPVQVTADYLALPPDGARAVVRAQVGLAGLRWRQAGRRQVATVDLVGGAYDAGGSPVGPVFGRRVDLDLDPAELKRSPEQSFQYQHQLLLSPGRYEIRVVAREPGLAPLGGGTQRIDIPDLGAGGLTLSSVFLSSAVKEPSTTGAESEVLRDAHALRRFQRGDSLYFQLYVYNVKPDESGATDVVLQAQLRAGGKTIAASKPQPVRFEQKNGVPLPQSNGMPLEGLDPGSYELRVVVVDRKANLTAFRSVDFTLE